MDRSKTATLNAADQLSLSKSRLRTSVASFAPLDLVRRNPLTSVGVAFTTGVALSKMPRTRDTLFRTLDLALNLVLKLAVSPLSLACAKPKDPAPDKDAAKPGVP